LRETFNQLISRTQLLVFFQEQDVGRFASLAYHLGLDFEIRFPAAMTIFADCSRPVNERSTPLEFWPDELLRALAGKT
jgi:hypothetical protein